MQQVFTCYLELYTFRHFYNLLILEFYLMYFVIAFNICLTSNVIYLLFQSCSSYYIVNILYAASILMKMYQDFNLLICMQFLRYYIKIVQIY